MTHNNQHIAILIFIPMLLFTFIVTINTQTYSDNPRNVIYDYFEFKNKKDINSISEILYKKDNIYPIKEQLSYIEEIHILNVKEYKNNSLLNLYLNTNDYKNTEVKVFKIEYSVSYKNNDTQKYYKDGEYESLCFLLRDNDSSQWLLDPYDFY